MPAPALHVFLSPVSAPEAGPEHTCPHGPAGAQASTGIFAGTGTARGGFGGGWRSVHLDPQSRRRFCQGRQAGRQDPHGPQSLWVGVARVTGTCAARGGLGGGRAQDWDPCGPQRLWRRQVPCLAPSWSEAALAGTGLRPGTLAGLPGLEGWASLLRCVPPPLPKEGGQRGAPQWWPCSLHTTQHGRPASLVAQAPANLPAVEPFPLPLQAVSSPPTAVPSRGPPSKTYCLAPSSPPHQEAHNPGQSAQVHSLDHVHRAHFVPVPADQLLHSSPSP